MTTVTVHVAKTQLSKLIALAEAGEVVVILRGREPVVRLVPVHQERPIRRYGALRGKVEAPADFLDPLTNEELEAWER